MFRIERICPHLNKLEYIEKTKYRDNWATYAYTRGSMFLPVNYLSENRKGWWFSMHLPNGDIAKMFFSRSLWTLVKDDENGI